MIRFSRLRGRLIQSLGFEVRPDLHFITDAIQGALRDRLRAEDSASRKAVLIGDSERLARLLGLRKTRFLELRYPDFTIENLALLSNEYDFVIADRVLHRCRDLEDTARETTRVLRPGGWFVHTSCPLDFALEVAIDPRRFGPSGLRRLFRPISTPPTACAHMWSGVCSLIRTNSWSSIQAHRSRTFCPEIRRSRPSSCRGDCTARRASATARPR